jgi:hypothetical protein
MYAGRAKRRSLAGRPVPIDALIGIGKLLTGVSETHWDARGGRTVPMARTLQVLD